MRFDDAVLPVASSIAVVKSDDDEGGFHRSEPIGGAANGIPMHCCVSVPMNEQLIAPRPGRRWSIRTPVNSRTKVVGGGAARPGGGINIF